MTNTIWLSLLTFPFTYVIAIPLGIISGRYHDTWADRVNYGLYLLGLRGAAVYIRAD